MIFVRDKGRMCNNILQYGHLYAWGRENHRTTMSMRFAYKYPFFHICHTRYHNLFVYLFAKYGCKWRLIPKVSFHEKNEPTTEQEHAMLTHKFILAEGWYVQFPKLFLKYKEDIKALFAFLPEVEAQTEKILTAADNSTLRLGVHIRRGDYATWQGGKYLFSDAQYISIIQQFAQLHPDRQIDVFVCGNDPHLNKECYRESLPALHIYFPEGNPGEDLCLLSKCDYLIGAPSTFTLVASLYHDLPLYWIKDIEAPLTEESFGRFDDLFQHII